MATQSSDAECEYTKISQNKRLATSRSSNTVGSVVFGLCIAGSGYYTRKTYKEDGNVSTATIALGIIVIVFIVLFVLCIVSLSTSDEDWKKNKIEKLSDELAAKSRKLTQESEFLASRKIRLACLKS